ncbi:MAG: transcription antitermination factor NusB [Candidatus Melainabacteria bacterium RIFOXYA12_FULL_32_12]|nr:MAG: transcription antitermination factor NusB [Candidatus Melainabacteria bacterium RIFOXYA2_FULL_32_9]OGI26878.1 MAG: transcription antitermination factor NusB [Candidatus Melainabacteria bacterium RIFOXYA12_FULL_32_12]
MKARRAARELALLAFSQLSKDIETLKDKELEEIVVLSVRTLVNNAENELKKTLSALFDTREFIENYEIDHQENIKRPVEAPVLPVPIPLTSDMVGRIDTVIDAIDKTFSATEIVELSSLANQEEVKEYIIRLVKIYVENKKEVDDQISKCAKGWNIERLVRIDRDILRIAIVELLYFADIPLSVSIDEAVELAKKYSTEESSSFINGILRQVVEENKLYGQKS